MNAEMLQEYWRYATCLSNGIPWMLSEEIVPGARFESPFKLKRGVVLSLDAICRAA